MLIVVKVGTDSVIGNIKKISEDIVALKKDGHSVILVSSGAVGLGREIYPPLLSSPPEKQILASLGQVELIKNYQIEFSKHGYFVGQILITKKDFEGKTEMDSFETMINLMLSKKNIIPIVNENDSIALAELMFTDNDEIAGTLASFLGADKFIILTNVDGVYDDFFSSNRKVISNIKINEIPEISSEKSSLGRGGMQSKVNIAKKLAKLGIETIICKVSNENVLQRIIDGEEIGTKFIPAKSKKTDNIRRHLAFDVGIKTYGAIIINECLEQLIKTSQNAFSILPVGLLSLNGNFSRGDIIEIKNQTGNLLGYGLARYSSTELLKIIGKEGQKPILRYEYMYIF